MKTASLKIAALVASALVAALAAGRAEAGGIDSFTDMAHDGGHHALDITRVSVASDDDGRIAFDVGISNYMHLPAEGFLAVYIDSDASDATGSRLGADFALTLSEGTQSTITHDLARWTGTAWDFSVPAASLTSSFLHGARLTVNRRDLGNTERFDYRVGTLYTVSGVDHSDVAPDSGTRSFDLKLPASHAGHTSSAPSATNASSTSSSTPSGQPSHTHPSTIASQPSSGATSKGGGGSAPPGSKPQPATGGPTSAPKAGIAVKRAATTGVARRGKLFGVGIEVQQKATGEPVTSGQIGCSGKIAGRPIKLRTKFFEDGMAICGWKIPRTARGRLTVSIRVSTGGASVTKRFFARLA
jgi:hypothetical protein